MNPHKFDPSPDNEDPVDDLDRWCHVNWLRVDPLIRKDCEDHLLHSIEEAGDSEVLEHWKDQHRRGVSIGSDDPHFHHGVGRMVRNKLREQYTDGELPEVTASHEGKPYEGRNWDDYYQGVLMEICSR